MNREHVTRPAYSFVVDRGSRFAYQGWILAHSLTQLCAAEASDIHVQCTAEADVHARRLFEAAGFSTHTLKRFGDGKFCNKIAQFENLESVDNDVIVLLDTDTIAVSDLRRWLSREAVLAKVVDAANPPLPALREIAHAAGLKISTGVCRTDSSDGETYCGNCNGGMYAIPRQHATALAREWQRWALWLLRNIEPLKRCGKENHVDQVSFWLALMSSGVPFRPTTSNANYFIHMDRPHLYLDTTEDIALLHYHNSSLNVVGLIEPPGSPDEPAQKAVATANELIGRNFNNALFWSYRYENFPERGSGIGSRGANLDYKRALLRREGIEGAASVLDFGCGDLEVVRSLTLRNYIGLDVAPTALQRARVAMGDGDFRLGMDSSAPISDYVLCLEVLTHQPTLRDYLSIVEFVAYRSRRTLIVSGYTAQTEAISRNGMVFFHEPLEVSLVRTGKFGSIRQVGAHTDVVIYRCDV